MHKIHKICRKPNTEWKKERIMQSEEQLQWNRHSETDWEWIHQRKCTKLPPFILKGWKKLLSTSMEVCSSFTNQNISLCLYSKGCNILLKNLNNLSRKILALYPPGIWLSVCVCAFVPCTIPCRCSGRNLQSKKGIEEWLNPAQKTQGKKSFCGEVALKILLLKQRLSPTA